MLISNDGSESHLGNLVAVEGNADLVATQLRLLPPSSKILILPPLSTALPSVNAEPFEARRWVRYVYHAFNSRHETARSFLKPSTSDQPRLVFVNGGSVSARVECIYRIAEQLTNGRIAEAETIFNNIVKDGVAGILRTDQDEEEEVVKEDIVAPKDIFDPQLEKAQILHDYRGAIAMEAADRLDRQTAELQTPIRETFQVSRKRGRDDLFSLLDNEMHQNYKFQEDEELNYPDFSDGPIRATVVTISDEDEDRDSVSTTSKQSTFDTLPSTTYTPNLHTNRTVRRDSDYDEDGEEYVLCNEDKFEGLPGTIEVGHAAVIRVKSDTSPLNMRSVKSVDRLTQGTINHRRRSRSLTPKPISTRGIAHRTAVLKGFQHKRRSSLSDLEKPTPSPFVRAVPTTIKKPSRKSSGRSSLVNSIKSLRLLYVDRGTDTHPACSPSRAIPPTPSTVETEKEIPSIQPVFAIIEDLVIHFTDGADNSLLESVVQSYKNGSYPVIPISEPEFRSLQPCSPQSISGLTEERLRHLSNWTAETDDFGYGRRHEINPYNDDQVEQRNPRWPQRRGTRIENPVVSAPAPLSPAATPPLTPMGIADRFHRFCPINSKTATGIQNSLRAALNVYYPPELTNYRQYTVPLDCDRLWKPVFRNSDGNSQEGRTVDQIIAIGAEDGVKSNFFNEIAGQVERLGTKKNGTTQSGKLDMRFLIASAMQTFTKQSLSLQSQSASSPFSSPMLLASLLVPQLETYLASNASIRLLVIHYSSSHLPTILALRHLVGADTFRVAGILESLSPVPASSQTPPAHSAGNRLSNDNVAAYNDRTRSASKYRAGSLRSINNHSPTQSIEFKHNGSEPASTSFSRVNYLLPSTATDTEIATFLSNITNHLIEKSTYYTPEPTFYNGKRRSSGPNTPTYSTFPPPSPTSPSNKRKSTTNSTSRPITPGRDREFRIGQSVNSIVRPQSKSNHTTPTKSALTNHSKINGDSNNQLLTSPNFTSPSTHQFTRSLDSTSILSSPPSQFPSQNPILPTSSNPILRNTNNNNNNNNNNNSNKTPTSTSITPITNGNGNSNTRPNTAISLSRHTIAAPETEARERQSERDWASFYFGDSDDEDDFDRALMPKVQKRVERRKGDSRKALVWLGLA